jgi:YD repeat-containing protein
VDAANQLQAQIALGPRRIVGTVNEPSHVKINGNFVPVDENFRFEGMVDSSETRNVTIEATDADNNVTTTEYRFAEPDNTAGAVLRHDANGRLVEIERPDETVSYTWDAMDQLIQAEVMARDGSTGKRKTYGYDPAGRMVRTDLETWDGSSWVVSGTGEQYIYAGLDKIQKRVTNNTLIARSYYADGYITGSTRYYYGRDHLGSIVELVEGSTGNIVSTREFSPYGEILSETGTTFASFVFNVHND